MATFLLSEDVDKAKARYRVITLDIAENKNLLERLKEIDEAISNVDDSIAKAIRAGKPYTGMNALKNELWHLKYQILEKT